MDVVKRAKPAWRLRRLWLRVLLRVEVAAADFDAVECVRQQIADLPGYADYAARVRYRLLPGIW